MLSIKKGENALLKRFLKKKDKTDFNRSEFSEFTLDLIQGGVVVESYEFPSTHLRAGAEDNEIEIEVSTAVSERFVGGKVVAKYIFTIPDADLEDDEFTQILTEEILDVEQIP